MAQNQRSRARTRRGYTLIEMMIVMVILIVVMALVAPVIGNARNAAKRTNTQQLLNNLAQASQQFIIDQRREPGYFVEADMGSQENDTRGFSGAQNIMLDLAGGIVSGPAGNNPDPTDWLPGIGPVNAAANQVNVRRSLIAAPTETKGVVNKGYFTPDPKYFVSAQPVGMTDQDGTQKHRASVREHRILPDLIDGFGQPILAWRMDLEPAAGVEFAAMDSTATRASFYRASNSAFLKAEKLGKKEQDQTTNVQGENGSLLSIGFADQVVALSMRGLLGNPAFPLPNANPLAPTVPAAARGRLVFHAAGTDGVFLGMKDRGGIIGTAPDSPGHLRNVVDYRAQRDAPDNFDDVITVAGN